MLTMENGLIYLEIVSCQEQNQDLIYCIKLRLHAHSTANANASHTHKSTHSFHISVIILLVCCAWTNECLHAYLWVEG